VGAAPRGEGMTEETAVVLEETRDAVLERSQRLAWPCEGELELRESSSTTSEVLKPDSPRVLYPERIMPRGLARLSLDGLPALVWSAEAEEVLSARDSTETRLSTEAPRIERTTEEGVRLGTGGSAPSSSRRGLFPESGPLPKPPKHKPEPSESRDELGCCRPHEFAVSSDSVRFGGGGLASKLDGPTETVRLGGGGLPHAPMGTPDAVRRTGGGLPTVPVGPRGGAAAAAEARPAAAAAAVSEVPAA